MSMLRIASLAAALAALAPGLLAAADLDFNRDVRPILSDKCYHCHGPDEQNRKAGLRLDTPAGAARALKGAKPEETRFVQRITSSDPDEQMPPTESNFSKRLTPKEIATLTAWVASGARYARHWAFEPPQPPALPEVADPAWQKPIDRLVAGRLTREGLRPAPRADRVTLIRRATLDLTGLPPTPEEVDAFVADTAPDAYEKVVDRLLKSPRYGERMALLWLDLARYGDSSVYHADGPRDMWGWRDYVIKSFNDNKPFDRFTVEQLAGDLLPDATVEQKIGSGFNRNHATTDEGGVIPEEFRVDYVADRVKTVGNVWLAMSLECAQCHDHKYDPLSQREYYQFFAYFNNTKDPGMQTRNGNTAPLLEVPDPDAESRHAAAVAARKEAEARLAEHRARVATGKPFAEWLARQAAPPGVTAPAAEVAFFLPLDEKDGRLTANDGRAGTPDGKATEAKRPGGDGLRMAGDCLVEFADGPEIDAKEPFTFAAWVKVAAKGGGVVLARMDNDNAFRGFDIGLEEGRPGLHLVHRWADDALKVYAKNAVTPDAWHHVVITSDGTGKAAGIAIHVDGVAQEKVVSADSLAGTVAANVPTRLGSRSGGGRFNGALDDVALYRGVLTGEEVKRAAADPISRVLAVPADQRTPAQTGLLAGQFLRNGDTQYGRLLKDLGAKLTAERQARRGKTTVMVMEDLPPNQMRPTYILNRGQYDQPRKDQSVKPGVPAALPPLPADAPANRLGLARWLVRPDHPLTGRVAVNRLWQMVFGEGLVRTSEDFGLQGESPSHPELLDWLATDFVKSGWDVKRALKQLVMSETYCQDSRADAALRERDPENRLLARGPRFRLQAEFLRDQALFVGGLLVEKVGGPSVRPYQPAGVWEEVALDTNLSKYTQDKGEKLYRRSMYIYWKRSSPHPTMMTFDAPSREKCTGSRPRTNTPLQALVTLNDPQFVEAARGFGQRIIKEGGASTDDRIRHAYRLALGRPATEREVALLRRLVEGQLNRFRADPKKAEALLKIGESERDATIPPAEHAAWMVVASTVLNLDEFLVKN